MDTSGFLRAYKASNISSSKPDLDFHADEIIQLIKEIQPKLSDDKLISYLNKCEAELELSKNKIDPNQLTISYKKFSQYFQDFLKEFKANDSQQSQYILSLIRKILYHFFNLAKRVDDQEVLNESKNMAFIFS